MGYSLGYLGSVFLRKGEYNSAKDLLEKACALFEEIGDRPLLGGVLHVLGEVARHQHDYAAARALYERSAAIRRELGDKQRISATLSSIGTLENAQADYESACSHFEDSLLLVKTDTAGKYEGWGSNGIAQSIVGLARIAVARGDPERAVQLLGAGRALAEHYGDVFLPADRAEIEDILSATRRQLEHEHWQAAWERGRAMNMEQAIAYALQDAYEGQPVAGLLAAPEAARTAKRNYPNELSRREVEVLRLLAQGLTNYQIAERLFLSTNTVRAHLYSIYSKLGVSNRTAAAHFVQEYQLM